MSVTRSDQPTEPVVPGYLRQRMDRCAEVLALSPASQVLLGILTGQEVDPSGSWRDQHGRTGVVGWHQILEHLVAGGATELEAERAIDQLSDWNLLQVVGRSPGDPIVPGPGALRLTPDGRACVGLAPLPEVAVELPEAASGSWRVIHGLRRERLLTAASEDIGLVAWRPVRARSGQDGIAATCGAIARALCAQGSLVLDGFGVGEQDRADVLSEIVWRTREARGPRILVVPDPAPLRPIAVVTDLQMEWIEPIDARLNQEPGAELGISRALLAARADRHGSSLADLYGVPGGGVAMPRHCDTRWEDLVVPPGVRMQLDQMQMHARFRLKTLPGRTHFRGRGGGYRLLLSGLPGTGKSMAAEALSNALGCSLVKLDLSSVLSKWLGETEQLIGKVFDLAEATESVLVLDEAEALFRQRQSGSSGANALSTAVAYLLTRLERYRGVLVATTNRTQDVDEAFFRRFNDYIVLPMPDPDERRILWKTMLGCGEELDYEGLGIDLELLAERFILSGGLIRGAAIRAQAWAMGLGQPVSMAVILAALGRELEKSDRALREVLVQPYAGDVAKLLHLEDYYDGTRSR